MSNREQEYCNNITLKFDNPKTSAETYWLNLFKFQDKSKPL